MAGSRRRRRRRARALLPQQGTEPSPPEDAALSSREVTTVESPCHASASTFLPMPGPHVCADLLDSLLHEIIALFNSFQDFLAFIGTCHSWRTAVSTFPSVYTFSFPPLHFKPDGPYIHPHSGDIKPILLSNCKWQLSDPTKKNLSLVCSVPENSPNAMHYLGCSYGYLIFSYEEHCLLVDVYTGTKVKPPKLPPNNNLGYFCGIGILTAPLISANSRLLLFSKISMFEWQVGANSWSEHALDLGRERIYQIVFFKGDIFAIDALMRLHTIHLTPRFSMREVPIQWEFLPINSWLVVCGDMLLMIAQRSNSGGLGSSFKVFRLDFTVEPAKWVKVEKLENIALFVSLDRRDPTFSCMSPERWGGKSNCIYFARLSEDPDETWTSAELGQLVPENAIHPMFYGMSFPPDCGLLSNQWVFPSLIYGSG
ncbi:hypothetical protein CFC21_080863 [Triticum aestivum]|uniref:KIB1-4 beta-propeller domain-containing protein n=2 Tax=Triticum aestivum TaxID=4565 RepID=A0A9R1I2V7_WHEAT|nr:uncharacterized protein LOC123123732 [Triticum aestivum]KAF7076170.1 hypothetical protein CFC21_080863 [Triticum aestivum]